MHAYHASLIRAEDSSTWTYLDGRPGNLPTGLSLTCSSARQGRGSDGGTDGGGGDSKADISAGGGDEPNQQRHLSSGWHTSSLEIKLMPINSFKFLLFPTGLALAGVITGTVVAGLILVGLATWCGCLQIMSRSEYVSTSPLSNPP